MRILSGIQPSGKIHLGNYIGAIKQWLNLEKENECFFMIVDLHAITVDYNPKSLKENIFEAAIDYLALGINPKKSSIFIQSQVKEHAELSWLLGTIAPIGELERMTQFKEKSLKQKKGANLGLFAYPVLMAADILLYKTDLVPVGEDQVQHVELARTLARKFNSKFGKLFKEPKEILPKFGERIMSLTNPKKKMSKSEGEASYIALFEDENSIRKKIQGAVTDSGKEIKYEPKTKPAISNLLTIYHQMSGKTINEIENEYKNKGYAKFKNDLAEIMIEKLKPAREKRKELIKNKDYVYAILKEGKEKTRTIAENTMKEIKEAMGLIV